MQAYNSFYNENEGSNPCSTSAKRQKRQIRPIVFIVETLVTYNIYAYLVRLIKQYNYSLFKLPLFLITIFQDRINKLTVNLIG